jgi:hypothetical protein
VLAAFVAAAIDDDSLPSPSIGGSAAIAFLPRPLRLEASAAIWASSRSTLQSGAGGQFSLWNAGGRACGAIPAGPLEIGPCGAVDFASMHAQGYGGTAQFTGDAMWAIVSVGVDAFWAAIPPFGLRLRLDGFAPTSRPSFVVLEPSAHLPAHRPALGGLRAALGVETRFL